MPQAGELPPIAQDNAHVDRNEAKPVESITGQRAQELVRAVKPYLPEIASLVPGPFPFTKFGEFQQDVEHASQDEPFVDNASQDSNRDFVFLNQLATIEQALQNTERPGVSLTKEQRRALVKNEVQKLSNADGDEGAYRYSVADPRYNKEEALRTRYLKQREREDRGVTNKHSKSPHRILHLISRMFNKEVTVSPERIADIIQQAAEEHWYDRSGNNVTLHAGKENGDELYEIKTALNKLPRERTALRMEDLFVREETERKKSALQKLVSAGLDIGKLDSSTSIIDRILGEKEYSPYIITSLFANTQDRGSAGPGAIYLIALSYKWSAYRQRVHIEDLPEKKDKQNARRVLRLLRGRADYYMQLASKLGPPDESSPAYKIYLDQDKNLTERLDEFQR